MDLAPHPFHFYNVDKTISRLLRDYKLCKWFKDYYYSMMEEELAWSDHCQALREAKKTARHSDPGREYQDAWYSNKGDELPHIDQDDLADLNDTLHQYGSRHKLRQPDANTRLLSHPTDFLAWQAPLHAQGGWSDDFSSAETTLLSSMLQTLKDYLAITRSLTSKIMTWRSHYKQHYFNYICNINKIQNLARKLLPKPISP